jgi:hypothetical protein
MKRDMQKDLEMCEKATPGNWKLQMVDGKLSIIFVPNDISIFGCKAIVMSSGYSEKNGGVWDTWIQCRLDDARFIAESREALPYYIKQCQDLEERNKKLQIELCKRDIDEAEMSGDLHLAEACRDDLKALEGAE